MVELGVGKKLGMYIYEVYFKLGELFWFRFNLKLVYGIVIFIEIGWVDFKGDYYVLDFMLGFDIIDLGFIFTRFNGISK